MRQPKLFSPRVLIAIALLLVCVIAVALCWRARQPLHRLQGPNLVYWAWERPEDLRFYTLLFDQRRDVPQEPGFHGDPKQFAEKTTELQQDQLTDWIATFQVSGTTDHALEMWRAHGDSLPWLLAVLSKTDASSSFAPEILAAADRVPSASPAYISVFFHRMRLRKDSGTYKEVRQAIDALLASGAELPAEAKDDILDLRLDAAGDLNDAIRFLARDSCDLEHRGQGCSPELGLHSAQYLDTMPLDLLLQVVQSPALPQEARNKFARNVWMRAVLLGRHDVAQSLDAFVQDPSLFPGNPAHETVVEWVKQYESAATPEEKQFAALFLLQHQLAVGYTMESAGEWCANPYAFSEDSAPYSLPPRPALPSAMCLTEAQRKQAAAEQEALDHVDSQANYYAKTTTDFALKHPADPRVPEALSRAVKNTRMNCNNGRTEELSKQAFDLLHNRYPATSWAKNTKYWFGNNPY